MRGNELCAPLFAFALCKHHIAFLLQKINYSMNKLILIFPVLAFIFFLENTVFESTAPKGSIPRVGELAPEFSIPQPDGKTLTLSDYKGKYVLLDFWASWCGPCLRDAPHMRKIQETYGEKNFTLLGVSLDTKKGKWKSAIARYELDWPHGSDLGGWDSQVAKTYGVTSIPHTVLISPEGEILAIGLRGEQLDKKLKRELGQK